MGPPVCTGVHRKTCLDGASVCDDEKVLEADGGDGCPTLRVCFMPLNDVVKVVEMVNFIVCLYLFLKRTYVCTPTSGRLQTQTTSRTLESLGGPVTLQTPGWGDKAQGEAGPPHQPLGGGEEVPLACWITHIPHRETESVTRWGS